MTDRMIRKQLYMSREQDALLSRRARELGTTQAQLVREALDAYGRDVPAAAAATPSHRDLAAWREEKAFLEALARRASSPRRTDDTSSARPWTRDDLHER